jgi:ribonucleotide reductase alpha subunit
MKVLKRSGDSTEMLFDKVTKRLQKLNQSPEFEPLVGVQPDKVAQKVFSSMYDGISTADIDNLTAEVAIGMITENPDYETLAMRVTVSNLQKNCPKCFSDAMVALHVKGVVSDEFMKCVALQLDGEIVHKRDYDFGYFGIKTLQKGYLNEGETPQYLLMRVAVGIHGDDIPRVKETYHLMSQKYFTHATPTLFNAGTKRPQMSSCFLVAMKDDSIDGIYETLKECAHISKWSGGIGIHCSNIRANGTRIKGTNGVADGIVPMLRVFNNTARYVNQGGGKRKGSFAIYLEPWHADIMEFLELRLNQGDEEMRCRDLFTAMWIPDLFMEQVEKDADWHLMCPHECPGLPDVYGEEFNELYRTYVAQGRFKKVVKARTIWDAILKSQIETGTPYMCYKDSVNAKSNQKNIGTIKSSNLCVAPETKILTRNGYIRITALQDLKVDVWNGFEWSEVEVKKTSESSHLVRVNMSDGTFIECTDYHKFHLQVGYGNKSEIKQARELEPGDKLIKWTPPSPIEFEGDFKYPYTHGFFCGDGTYHATYQGDKTIPGISLYGEKKNLIDHLDVRTTSGNEDAGGRINVLLPYDLPKKFRVPSNFSVKSRLDWFAGLCDADGHTQGCPGNPTQKSISVGSIHLSFLRDIQLMLHTLGVSSNIGLLHEAGERELPDGKGGKKMFDTQTCWRLVVSALGVEALINAGFNTHRLDLSDFTPVTRDVRQYVRVVSIEDNARIDETYCFNEPKRHMGIFNGVITGNCTEIMEVSGPDETAVCNLASLCLPTFVKEDTDGLEFDFDELGRVTRVVTRNLNRVIDKNYYPTEAARKSNMRHRPIGIGVQGLADVFQMLGLPFDSDKARWLNKEIFEWIYHEALTESCQLAEEEGPYETFQGSPASQGILQPDMWGPEFKKYDIIREMVKTHGLRNSLLVAPMPTASTAQIMGNNEAFEPYTTNIYLRRTLAGEFVMVNKHLVRDLQKLDMWNPSIKNEIIRAGGSVQGLDGIPETLKNIYRTVWEIPQKSILDMAADRGAYIDQSQSLNIFMENPSVAKLSSMHFYGFKKSLKTGMYYLRTRSKAKPQQVTIAPTTLSLSPAVPTEEEVLACSLANPEGCLMCSG